MTASVFQCIFYSFNLFKLNFGWTLMKIFNLYIFYLTFLQFDIFYLTFLQLDILYLTFAIWHFCNLTFFTSHFSNLTPFYLRFLEFDILLLDIFGIWHFFFEIFYLTFLLYAIFFIDIFAIWHFSVASSVLYSNLCVFDSNFIFLFFLCFFNFALCVQKYVLWMWIFYA